MSTRYQRAARVARTEWSVGAVVKVGFVAGLTVLAKVATPGDGLPDAYILSRGSRFYEFVPHNGLQAVSQQYALEQIEVAQRQRNRMELDAAAKAAVCLEAARIVSKVIGQQVAA